MAVSGQEFTRRVVEFLGDEYKDEVESALRDFTSEDTEDDPVTDYLTLFGSGLSKLVEEFKNAPRGSEEARAYVHSLAAILSTE